MQVRYLTWEQRTKIILILATIGAEEFSNKLAHTQLANVANMFANNLTTYTCLKQLFFFPLDDFNCIFFIFRSVFSFVLLFEDNIWNFS